MKIENFIKLINSITKREFHIKTNDIELQLGKTYFIYKITPIKKIVSGFEFKVPKSEESIIKSFINKFCNKYKEPNPLAYNGKYGSDWAKMTDVEKEYAYMHHTSKMFNKTQLLEQIKKNMLDSDIEDVLCKYGFYYTSYGIGIFVLYGGQYEINAINRMKIYLSKNNIPFKNQMSNANWVFRFIININKDYHKTLLSNFNRI